jgi:hypothetical protein
MRMQWRQLHWFSMAMKTVPNPITQPLMAENIRLTIQIPLYPKSPPDDRKEVSHLISTVPDVL